jgi:hypothetical protein
MIINGKEVEVDFRRAAQIQDRVNKVEQLPDNSKTEVNNRELKELQDISSNTFENFDGYGMTNNMLLTGKKPKENRKDYYTTFQEMSESNFIHRGLQIIADDCSQKNNEGHTVKVYSDDDEIKEILEKLYYERLNIDKELWSIVYETCKFGDNFYEIIPDSYKNPTMVARIRYLEPERVNRIEKNGKLAFYTYTADTTDPEEVLFRTSDNPTKKKDEDKVIYKLEPWQIVHFRIIDKDFYPYGGSLLKAGVKAFRRLQLLEDGITIYRLARVPERRVFKIDCGNLPQSEANRQVQRIKDNYRTSQILDDRGNINRQASALSLTQDIFVPVREGGSGTEITTLQGGTALNNIDDIRYFRDQVLWTMNIPPEYLGFTSDQSGGSQGRGSLAMQDIKFSRFVERIQYCIEESLVKIAAIELFFNHKKKSDLKNFKIELTPPSNIKEIMELEYTTNKMNLIQAMNGTGLFPKKFILQYVMKMSKKEIDNLVFFKDLEAQAGQAQENGMIGGMMGAAGMDTGAAPEGATAGGDVGAAPAPAPAASINTEDLEKNLVRIFGKDILIENKEDFVKLVKAAEDYNNSLKEEKPETVVEEFDENLIIYEKEEVKKTNEQAISMIYENELGGLNYDSSKYKVFAEPKKKTGPKTSSNPFLYEETSYDL